MSFCKYCGRQLQDGEVCTCQQPQQAPVQQAAPQQTMGGAAQPQRGFNQQPGQQMFQQGYNHQQAGQQMFQQGYNQQAYQSSKPAGPNPMTEIIELLKGIFVSPAETVSAFAIKANVIMIAILVGGQALINMLTRLFDMLIANAKAHNIHKYDIIMYGYYGYNKPYEVGAIFKNMFLEILLVAVSAAVFALVVMLLAKAFHKADVTYVQGLAVYAVTAVLGIPAKLLSWAIGLTSVAFLDTISSCVSVFANIAGFAFVYIAIHAICKDEKKIPLIMALSYVAVNFMTWVVGLMF